MWERRFNQNSIPIYDIWKKSIKFRFPEVCRIEDINYEYYKDFKKLVKEFVSHRHLIKDNEAEHFCKLCPMIDFENKRIGYYLDWNSYQLSVSNCFFIYTDIETVEKIGKIDFKNTKKEINKFEIMDI